MRRTKLTQPIHWTVRHLASAAIAITLALLASGCSSATNSTSNAIVTFDGQTTITKATLDHWIPIEAIISRTLWPQTPPLPGAVPDPPNYTACITYERANPPLPFQATPTIAQLKHDCETRYHQVREHMLQLLIRYAWMNTEAKTHHITVTHQELQAANNHYNHETFHTTTAYHNYLKATGLTPADQLKITLFDIQATKLREQILPKGIPTLTHFYHQYPKELAAKTNCTPQYTIPDCKQYKGTKPPPG